MFVVSLIGFRMMVWMKFRGFLGGRFMVGVWVCSVWAYFDFLVCGCCVVGCDLFVVCVRICCWARWMVVVIFCGFGFVRCCGAVLAGAL